MTSTKIISARVPMDSYIQLLNDAKKHNINISDYILLKVFDKADISLKHRQISEIVKACSEIATSNLTDDLIVKGSSRKILDIIYDTFSDVFILNKLMTEKIKFKDRS